VDGALVGKVGPKVMREREMLGENGFVLPSCATTAAQGGAWDNLVS
jgi:mRNA degradation ribonuclease J1/J2